MLPLYPMSTVVVSQALRPFAFDIRDTHVKGRLDRARIHSHCTATATHVVVGGHGPHGQGGRRPRPSPAFSLESAKLPKSVGQIRVRPIVIFWLLGRYLIPGISKMSNIRPIPNTYLISGLT